MSTYHIYDESAINCTISIFLNDDLHILSEDNGILSEHAKNIKKQPNRGEKNEIRRFEKQVPKETRLLKLRHPSIEVEEVSKKEKKQKYVSKKLFNPQRDYDRDSKLIEVNGCSMGKY